MMKIIYDETNGLYYNLSDYSIYHHTLTVGDEEEYVIGKYGMLKNFF